MPGDDKYRSQTNRQSSAFEALDVMLCTLLRRQSTVREGLHDFNEASPALAYWLKLYKAEAAAADKAECSRKAA